MALMQETLLFAAGAAASTVLASIIALAKSRWNQKTAQSKKDLGLEPGKHQTLVKQENKMPKMPILEVKHPGVDLDKEPKNIHGVPFVLSKELDKMVRENPDAFPSQQKWLDQE